MAEIDDDIEFQIANGFRISNLYENLKKEPIANRTKGFLLAKRQAIDEQWAEFKARHEVIFRAIPKASRSSNSYLAGEYYNDAYKVKSRMLIRLEEWLQLIMSSELGATQALAVANLQQAAPRQRESRLPQIKIESFSGNYQKWLAFKSIYVSLIHSKADISTIEKFHYLLSFLSGEAARVVSHYALTEANYVSAWDDLLGRYDNERAIVDSILVQLLGLPSITKESGAKIRELLDSAKECINSLHNWDIDTATWDPILIVIFVSKFDVDTRRLWEASITQPRKQQKLSALFNFMDNRFLALENQQKSLSADFQHSATPSATSNRSNYTNPFNKPSTSKPLRSHQTFLARPSGCDLCKDQHVLKACPEFAAADAKKKLSIIKRLGRCVNCFGKHPVNNCTSRTNCEKCHKRHNILLHFENAIATPASSARSSASTIPTVASHFTGGITAQAQVLLATALVRVFSSDGSPHALRCLIDPGSQSSFITTEAVQFLKLKRAHIVAPITGLGAVKAETATSMVEFSIFSQYNADFELVVQALVLSSITGHLPTSKFSDLGWEHIRGIELADPAYNRPGKIDVLLGADAVPHLMLGGLLHGSPGEPMAQNTKIGWILSGQVQQSSTVPTTAAHHTRNFHLRAAIDDQLSRFWELEELPVTRTWTEEEVECEQSFIATHSRDEATGRYTVSLPFKKNVKPLGKSRFQALSRLLQLEKKLQNKASYEKQYRDVIDEYAAMSHMELIRNPMDVASGYYLPHHAVIKEASSTTKLRVVFDASAKTTSGESLNEQLMVGPTMQEGLPSILIRWRTHRIVVSADVAKMYRQIRVRDEHTYYQKILWRKNTSDPVQEYRLQTLTFGTASAAYLAIRTMRQLAVDEAEKFVDASRVTLQDFYVDDLLTGADSEDSAKNLQRQLKNMLAAGGFELRKWISNSAALLRTIPEAEREVQLPLPIDMSDTTKTLGIHYHPSTDSFQFKICLDFSNKSPTKRSLLSESSKLFDPLGWLSPVLIKAKIMFQQLWKQKMTWDQKLDAELKDQWLEYREALHNLEDIVIPRWIRWTASSQRIEIHVFCDASEVAYAAVVYAKIINSDGSLQVTLLTSKTKVAPIKSVSLPRLELCGAVLAARLLTSTKSSLNLSNVRSFAWTDSTIVLAWLNGHPSKWKSFVANRVSEIQQNIDSKYWRHVKSEDNPADCASRGVGPANLKDHALWWRGPSWLQTAETQCQGEIGVFETDIDTKNSRIAMVALPGETSIIDDISSLKRLLRVVATCIRFSHNCKYKSNRRTGPITVAELANAQEVCVRLVQRAAFFDEIASLSAKQQVSNKSALRSLAPFIDDKGLLRVGGRLNHANMAYSQKHQVVLPSRGNFTKLIIEDAHMRVQHGGAVLVMNVLRSRFWVIGSRNAVKGVIHRCITCHRYRKLAHDQIMGSIPKVRISEAPPFKNVAIDYAGPINLKASTLRTTKTHKAWIALFVCMCTKAVHIELVTDLTTAAYLAAFDRFSARRGLPSSVYSDNAKTFVGADAELTRTFNRMLNATAIPETLAGLAVQWHFIPPRSPHFGGLWEAGIKSMKKHLHRVLGVTMLTFEEMTTVLTSIEASMNSRPLTPLTDDVSDLSALTPGHFLIGREIVATPCDDYADIASNRLTKWKFLKKLQQDFWRRWRVEYLCGLQQRNKWASTKEDIKVGRMVLLKEDNVPPSHWTLCRIAEVHPGSDGHVRVVTLRTPSGNLKRAISKICPLPIEA